MLHTGVGDLEFRSVYFVCLELFSTRTHRNNMQALLLSSTLSRVFVALQQNLLLHA